MPVPKKFVAEIRERELKNVSRYFPESGRVLDFGAGTGDQSVALKNMGYEVSALDVAGSDYSGETVFPVTFYDGRTIPFEDSSFDFIFSSNVLEHVPDIENIHAELRRVLKPGGIMIHILPSASWRFWTTLTAFPCAPALALRTLADPRMGANQPTLLKKALYKLWRATRRLGSPFIFARHGEWGNAFTELKTFGKTAWISYFRKQGYEILKYDTVSLFYTGSSMFGRTLSLEKRRSVASILGSSCHVFVIKPREPAQR